jgi:hypothetical protein
MIVGPLSVVVGKRTAEKTREVVEQFHRHTGGRPMDLITSDEYDAYEGRSSGPTVKG